MNRLPRSARQWLDEQCAAKGRDSHVATVARYIMRLEDTLCEVADSGVECDHDSVGYVVVQIDRGTWTDIRRYREEQG